MFTKKLIIAMMFILMLAAGSVHDDGLGDEDYPALAGLDAAAHIEMLNNFKGSDSEMADYVEDLSEQDIHDIAAYYATLSGK
jgi:cytochrome c553